MGDGYSAAMFVHNINPALLRLGPFEIRFYGIVYAAALLFLMWHLGKAARSGRVKNLTEERAADLVLYCMLALLVGARIAHVLTRLEDYAADPLHILFFWQGGLAFFGGFIGVIVAAYALTRRWGVSFMTLADEVVVPIPLFLALARVANFINAEMPGKFADVPWAVLFPGYAGARHPSQLYEAAAMLLLLGAMVLLFRRKARSGWKDGTLFWSFVCLYGALRFAVEFFKEADPVQLFGLSWMAYVSAGMLLVGAGMLLRMRRKSPA